MSPAPAPGQAASQGRKASTEAGPARELPARACELAQHKLDLCSQQRKIVAIEYQVNHANELDQSVAPVDWSTVNQFNAQLPVAKAQRDTLLHKIVAEYGEPFTLSDCGLEAKTWEEVRTLRLSPMFEEAVRKACRTPLEEREEVSIASMIRAFVSAPDLNRLNAVLDDIGHKHGWDACALAARWLDEHMDEWIGRAAPTWGGGRPVRSDLVRQDMQDTKVSCEAYAAMPPALFRERYERLESLVTGKGAP